MNFKSITRGFCVLITCLTLLFGLSINAFASDNLSDESVITFGETTFQKISSDQIPEQITPLVFENNAEKEAYFAEYFNNAQLIQPNNKIRNGIVEPMVTNGDALVAYKTYGATNAKVSLYVQYTTSGNNNTGTITDFDPYTNFTGITLSMEWNETACDGYITSNGKNIYAYARGEVISYLLVEGGIEVARTPVSLTGYAYCIH